MVKPYEGWAQPFSVLDKINVFPYTSPSGRLGEDIQFHLRGSHFCQFTRHFHLASLTLLVCTTWRLLGLLPCIFLLSLPFFGQNFGHATDASHTLTVWSPKFRRHQVNNFHPDSVMKKHHYSFSFWNLFIIAIIYLLILSSPCLSWLLRTSGCVWQWLGNWEDHLQQL